MIEVVLSDGELQRLDELENTIERGLATFVDVGNALLLIRDGRLYRTEYDTFEDYCRQRWNLDRTYAHRIIESARTAEMLPMDNRPTSERQARELAPLRDDPDEVADVWRETNERTNGKPTASAIREIRQEREEQHRSDRAAELIAEFPELDHYAERPDQAIRIGQQLRGYDERERERRRQILAKSIAAEQRRADQPKSDPGPDFYALAQRMFDAANAASKAIRVNGGADTFEQAVAGADPLEVENWENQFADLHMLCRQVAAACRPKLRRIK